MVIPDLLRNLSGVFSVAKHFCCPEHSRGICRTKPPLIKRMPDIAANKKTIAKNTLLLYARMLLIIAVGLYTSRVILDVLGVDDYGIYNVVGGVVAMLAFLNSALTAASQRFISYELGTGNIEKLKKIFCTSVLTHASLAVLIFIIAETLGLWFINEHLNIAPERMGAANWVYQISILTFMVSILSVPYNSCIVAHEHMKAFAYVSILEVILKLLIVYLLVVFKGDKLIIYAILVLIVAIIIRLIYGIYCKKHFEECTYRFVLDKGLFKEMFSFAGWSIIGNLGFSFKDQGSNIILNLFFGTAVNAARGVALQVNGVIANFSYNFMMALNPQITKQYAAGEIKNSVDLVYTGCRFSFYLLLLITTPVIINIDYLLELWLVTVPEYTSEFLTLALVAALINSMATPLVTALQATGNIKIFQIAICITMLCELPLAYIILYFGGKPYMAMYPTVLITLVGLFVRYIILKHQINEYNLRYFIISVFCKNVVIGSICILSSKYVHDLFDNNLGTFLLTSTISCILVISIIYFIGLTEREKNLFIRKIFNLITERIFKKKSTTKTRYNQS